MGKHQRRPAPAQRCHFDERSEEKSSPKVARISQSLRSFEMTIAGAAAKPSCATHEIRHSPIFMIIIYNIDIWPPG